MRKDRNSWWARILRLRRGPEPEPQEDDAEAIYRAWDDYFWEVSATHRDLIRLDARLDEIYLDHS